MHNKLLILMIIIIVPARSNGQRNNTLEKEAANKNYPKECSKFYWFENDLIDLDRLLVVEIDGLPATDFKTCSKYAHRFVESLNDSAHIDDNLFAIVNNRKTKTYELEIYQRKRLIKTIKVPVEKPLPTVC